uniref:HT-like protein n=1 Tax=Nicotiana tabacum TaxID=4097 RepID=B1Q4K0_TOBAC|nr:HT-like protein [Nicotiana tabacum]
MVFKSNLLLIKFSLLLLLMIFSEVAARDMPAQPSHPLLKSQWLNFVAPLIEYAASSAISHCIECNCCIPE